MATTRRGEIPSGIYLKEFVKTFVVRTPGAGCCSDELHRLPHFAGQTGDPGLRPNLIEIGTPIEVQRSRTQKHKANVQYVSQRNRSKGKRKSACSITVCAHWSGLGCELSIAPPTQPSSALPQ